MRPEITAGNIRIGRSPRVAGTIITADFLANAASQKLPCDLVELRLDGMQEATDWVDAGAAIQAAGTPVFATVRLAIEGGHWTRPDSERLPMLRSAIERLAGVDIELQSPFAREIAEAARAHGKFSIISSHHFQRTPSRDELMRIVRDGQEFGSIVKIAAMINAPDDLETLRSVLRESWQVPVCLIGMGPLGRESRLQFPLEGSCLTYGYLDSAGAPGQYSAAELTEFYRTRRIAA